VLKLINLLILFSFPVMAQMSYQELFKEESKVTLHGECFKTDYLIIKGKWHTIKEQDQFKAPIIRMKVAIQKEYWKSKHHIFSSIGVKSLTTRADNERFQISANRSGQSSIRINGYFNDENQRLEVTTLSINNIATSKNKEVLVSTTCDYSKPYSEVIQ
jgi:hypothetical protein